MIIRKIHSSEDFIGTCDGDYRKHAPVKYSVTLYGREFRVCVKHRHSKDLGGPHWRVDAKKDWLRDERLRTTGKKRYPRLQSSRDQVSRGIIKTVKAQIDGIKKSVFKAFYREWVKVNGFVEGGKALRKFVDCLGKK